MLFALVALAAGTLLRRQAYIDELLLENHYALVSRLGPHLVYNFLVIFDIRDPGYRDQVSKFRLKKTSNFFLNLLFFVASLMISRGILRKRSQDLQ